MTRALRPASADTDQLTLNFSLAELTRSDTADRLRIANDPTPAHRANLLSLALVLETIRRLVGGRRVRVHSGYRNPAVNAAVGGVANSAHALGLAADITVEGLSPRALALLLRDAMSAGSLRLDQLILETSRGVVHVSIAPALRGEVRTQAGGPGSPAPLGIRP